MLSVKHKLNSSLEVEVEKNPRHCSRGTAAPSMPFAGKQAASIKSIILKASVHCTKTKSEVQWMEVESSNDYIFFVLIFFSNLPLFLQFIYGKCGIMISIKRRESFLYHSIRQNRLESSMANICLYIYRL